MDTDPMADDVHQPTGTNEEQGDAAPLDPENVLGGRDYDEVLDEGYSPPEKPLGVTRHGTTAAEQRDGETLDRRLAQEVPDVAPPPGDGVGDTPGGEGEPVGPESGAERAGRLVAPDEGVRADTTKESVAEDVGIDGGAAGAEEAAVHVVEEDDTESPSGGGAGSGGDADRPGGGG
ncbi:MULTISPECIES: DUF5709 domain-containing protein [unclassified Streptomyces]|uniref:DUF5709 domain-containing protein n=1 Tax=unclassified Streptomyces TaxID=2593676 RepID=UPI0022371405|nr:DUF5709 domain-containing protein [Streptomyces sp. SHP 1-2]MCW5249714.1 hypothetical protein [Streptomyces sp. SHP 1-2]